MMGKNDGQMRMLILDIEALIPGNHLLRRINNSIDFSFIYEKAKPYYAEKNVHRVMRSA